MHYKKAFIMKKIFSVFIIPLTFLCDICLLTICKQPISYFCFSFILASNIYRQSWWTIGAHTALIILQQFIFYQQLDYHSILALTTYFLTSYSITYIASPFMALLAPLILFFIIDIGIAAAKNSFYSILTCFTIIKIFGTIFTLYFSLKWLSAVKQGNRLSD